MSGKTLQIESVSKTFGGLKAITDLSFEAPPGVTGIIGPNGAGKSTVFNLITGFIKPDQGRILLDGRDLSSLPPHKIATAGVRRTFQNIRLFAEQTALENVTVGALQSPQHRRVASARLAARSALDFMGLADSEDLHPSELPYAAQRRVEIARCLAADPDVILLDEPAAGMHASERADLVRSILDLSDRGLTVVLVEHDVALVSSVSAQVVVMDHGVKIASGTPSEIRRDPAVITAYLGAEDHD